MVEIWHENSVIGIRNFFLQKPLNVHFIPITTHYLEMHQFLAAVTMFFGNFGYFYALNAMISSM